MKEFNSILSVTLVFCLSGAALGQDGGKNGKVEPVETTARTPLPIPGTPNSSLYLAGASIVLINQSNVQTELKMTATQLSNLPRFNVELNKVKQVSRKARSEILMNAGADWFDVEKESKKAIESIAAGNDRLHEMVMEILNSEQRTRFEQLLFRHHVSRGEYVLALAVYRIALDGEANARLLVAEKQREQQVADELRRIEAASKRAMLSAVLNIKGEQLSRMYGNDSDLHPSNATVISPRAEVGVRRERPRKLPRWNPPVKP